MNSLSNVLMLSKREKSRANSKEALSDPRLPTHIKNAISYQNLISDLKTSWKQLQTTRNTARTDAWNAHSKPISQQI